jgi:cell division protein FtsL
MSLAAQRKDLPHHADWESRRHGENRQLKEKELHNARNSAQRSRRHRLMFFCFLAVALTVSGLFILSVFLQVAVAQNEMKARDMERQIELERRHQEEMRVEIAGLESPSRIELLAAKELDMVQVSQAEYLQTPAFQAAQIRQQERLEDKEGMVSDASGGGSIENQDMQR